MKTAKKFFITLVLTFMLAPILVSADGGFFPPPDYYMHETEQKAVIFYDQEIETLIISATFKTFRINRRKKYGTILIPESSDPETRIF